MTTLADVDVAVRIHALRAVLNAEPSLSAEQRAELVAAAVWPEAVETPGRAPAATRRRARQACPTPAPPSSQRAGAVVLDEAPLGLELLVTGFAVEDAAPGPPCDVRRLDHEVDVLGQA